jgi:hypothetical protein
MTESEPVSRPKPPIALTAVGALVGVAAVHAIAVKLGINAALIWGGDLCPASSVSCGAPPTGIGLGALVGGSGAPLFWRGAVAAMRGSETE